MRIYEELFIVKPDAPDEEVDQFIEQIGCEVVFTEMLLEPFLDLIYRLKSHGRILQRKRNPRDRASDRLRGAATLEHPDVS